MGPSGLEIFNSFNVKLKDVTLKQLFEKFNSYFIPKKNLTTVRHQFFTRRQASNEDVDSFYTDLKNKSLECDFGTMRESLVKDIFVCNF